MKKNIGSIIRSCNDRFKGWRQYANSRRQAHAIRNRIVKKRGSITVDRKMIRHIKSYAGKVFGSEGYWPWLAVYTELKGEFVEGWVPDDYYTFRLIPSLNPETAAQISLAKSFDYSLFGDAVVRPLAVRVNGMFYNNNGVAITERELIKVMKEFEGNVVIKKDAGPSGAGLLFKESGEVRIEDFVPGENYVIQPEVTQHNLLKKLSSSSVNTIRIVTLLNRDQHIDLFFSSLKFGTGNSKVDNVNMGGRFLVLNEEGVVVSNAYDELGLDTGPVHPGSGLQYKDFRVPSFLEAVKICKGAHLQFPYVRFIAWDVYIDKWGKPGIIEWNARLPGMWVNEAVAGPLWADAEIDQVGFRVDSWIKVNTL